MADKIIYLSVMTPRTNGFKTIEDWWANIWLSFDVENWKINQIIINPDMIPRILLRIDGIKCRTWIL